MQETLEATQLPSGQESTLPAISPATDEDIIAYLRRSHKIAEIADLAEREALILALCEQHSITVSDDQLQEAGDAFRREHRMLGASETLSWLSKHRISVEDWTQGIRFALLEKKLKEHLFGASVDSHYLNNRKDYRRIALSQILVRDLTDVLQIVSKLQEDKAAFCALALDYSKSQQSKEKGGFAGIHYLPKLMPEVAKAISEAKEGEIIEPVQTRLGYHIIKIEKWFPVELNESVREEILETLFQAWLRERSSSEVRESLPQ
ncbi:MAG TPA: peptidylprolyl isomerase [Chroococcales cyanobacterium]